MKIAHLLAGVVLLAGGCAALIEPSDDPFGGVSDVTSARIASALAANPLGSAENPVRANMPPGQVAYLRRLRCADSQAPSFVRQGSMGLGPYGRILDAYELTCAGSSPGSAVVYIDMYHPNHVETRAPAGFTITAP